MARDRIISDSPNDLKHDNNTANHRKANDNFMVDILEDNQVDESITSQCPVSIIPAQPMATSQETVPKDNPATTINLSELPDLRDS